MESRVVVKRSADEFLWESRICFFLFFLWALIGARYLAHEGFLNWQLRCLLLYPPGPVFLVPLGLAFLLALRFRVRWVFIWLMGLTLVLLGPGMGLRYPKDELLSRTGAVEFRVITVNVQTYGSDRSKVLESLIQLRPDVLILQELWEPDFLADLEGGFPNHSFFGGKTWLEGDGVFVAVSSEGKSIWAEDLDYSATSMTNVGGEATLVVGVHGSKRFGYSPAVVKRTLYGQRAQCQELVRRIEPYSGAMIVAGDFNAPPGGAFEDLKSLGLKDVFAEVGGGYGFTFPSSMPVTRLDRIYYSPKAVRPIRCRTVHVGSDHLALVADFASK